MFGNTNRAYKLGNELAINTERITCHQLPAPSTTSITDSFESIRVRTDLFRVDLASNQNSWEWGANSTATTVINESTSPTIFCDNPHIIHSHFWQRCRYQIAPSGHRQTRRWTLVVRRVKLVAPPSINTTPEQINFGFGEGRRDDGGKGLRLERRQRVWRENAFFLSKYCLRIS